MKFLPYERYCLHTRVPIDEVKQRMKESTGTREKLSTLFSSSMPRKEFDGRINGDRFELTGQNTGRNSCRPIISGEISERNNGVQVLIKMRMLSVV